MCSHFAHTFCCSCQATTFVWPVMLVHAAWVHIIFSASVLGSCRCHKHHTALFVSLKKTSRNTIPANLLWEKKYCSDWKKNKLKKTDSLPKTSNLPSVFMFAECFPSGTWRTSSLPSAALKTLGKKKHSVKRRFAKCKKNTRQTLSLSSFFLTLGKPPLYRVFFFVKCF